MAAPELNLLQIESAGEEQTRDLGRRLALLLRGGEVIALQGPLGAGKTALVRGLAEGLGIDPRQITSPTFVIAQEHAGSGGLRLVHMDAYRLSGPGELESIGFDELLEEPETIIAVEWAERIIAALPAERITIAIVIDPDDANRRELRIEAPEAIVGALREAPGSAPQRSCPTCGSALAPSAPEFPFCSSRCRYADLGRWFSGNYRISRTVREDEE